MVFSNNNDSFLIIILLFCSQVVYSKMSGENLKLYEVLQESAKKENICVVNGLELKDGNTEEVLEHLVEYEKTRAVVLLLDAEEIRRLFQSAEVVGTRGKFTWLGTRSWARDKAVTDDLESISEGAITLDLDEEDPIMEDFKDYFTSLKPETNTHNPWFSEFWQSHFRYN